MFRLRALPLIFSLAVVPFPATAEDMAALVNRVIAAYGGADTLSRFAAMRQTGRTVSIRRGGAVGALTRVFQRPNRLRVEIAYPGEVPEIRLLDGGRGWRGTKEVAGAMHGAMVLQAARLGLPLLLLEHLAELEDLGMHTGPDGVPIRVLRLPLRVDLALFVSIDAQSAQIRRSRGVMLAGARPAMEFAATYSDFRIWDGILIASREDLYVMGRNTGHTIIDRVELLDSVDSGTFRP